MDNRSAALRDTEGMFVLLTAFFEPLQSTSQVFKDATLFFSRSTPNLATVIPAMDHIDKLLSTNSLDAKYEPSIRAALGIAKKTLNRYYDKTDSSEVYRIAMGECSFTNLHLSHLLHCSQQSSTHDTNSNISNGPIGNLLGLQRQRTLSELNTTAHTPNEKCVYPRSSLHQPHRRRSQTYSTIYLLLLPPGQLSFVMISLDT